ncbi:sugar kinase [Priestia abyssalis]|uniref:sugar kinase n=1 Tax=Priestia abyssalis TaxID=1221450 RepID=UPI000994A7E7|nr:sugar kinase [Priestia abyssalis]
MKKVITFGEILLRLSPPGHSKIIKTPLFEVNYGGSEANVAASLSQYGISTSFVTKLPEHDLGDAAINKLKEYGVNASHISRGGNRIGIYFLENGYSVRPSKVVYDRKGSSIAEATINDFDVDVIFKDQDLFHLSGITLGISEESFQLAKTFIKAAKERGLKVSFDFNYRSKLWPLVQAKEKFEQILKYVDIVFAGHLDFTNILEMKPEKSLEETDIIHYYEDLYSKIYEKYPFEYIVSSIRDVKSASRNHYQGIIYDGKEIYQSREYAIDIIDRVGTGDAYTAGFLYGYLSNKENSYKVEFAAAAAALKHTIPGDMMISTVEEVENLFNSASFHVQR